MRSRDRSATSVRRFCPAVLMFLCSIASAGTAAAVVLQPGDIVMVQHGNGGEYPVYRNQVVRLDPATLAPTLIGVAGIATSVTAVAVDRTTRILLADRDAGIVVVDAGTGAQSVLVGTGLLGGSPGGLCAAPSGEIFASVNGSVPGIVRVSPDGGSVTPVSSGGLLTGPSGIAMGPDGSLYVCESSPADNGIRPGSSFHGRGSIVRVNPASGSQTLVAASAYFMGPFAIAFTGPGEVWTANTGSVAGRLGCFIRTRVSDGASQPAEPFDCRSQGIAATDDGTIYASDCHTIGPDCSTLFTIRFPGSGEATGLGGPMAVVPAGAVPVRRSSWGGVKTIYR